jgi:hypothetical protein
MGRVKELIVTIAIIILIGVAVIAWSVWQESAPLVSHVAPKIKETQNHPGQKQEAADEDIEWKTWDRSKLEYYEPEQEYFTVKLPPEFELQVVDKGWPYRIQATNDFKRRIWFTDSTQNIYERFKGMGKSGIDVKEIKNSRLSAKYPVVIYQLTTTHNFKCGECYYAPDSSYISVQTMVGKGRYYDFETTSDFDKDTLNKILQSFTVVPPSNQS